MTRTPPAQAQPRRRPTGLSVALASALSAALACGDDGPGGPDPGIAVDDFYVAAQGRSLTVEIGDGVLANDGEGAGGVDSFHRLSSKLGAVALLTDGSFTYAPIAGFWGRDTFSYTVVDPAGLESEAEVHIMVLPVPLRLAEIPESAAGFVLDGGGPGDRLSAVLAGLGDINGDGLDDLLIGAPGVDQGRIDNGRAYVALGHEDPEDLSNEALGGGELGFVIDGQGDGDRTASAAAGAGDVNGDGFADFVVCGPWADTAGGEESGRCYVVFGRSEFGANLSLGALVGGDGGFVINGGAAAGRAGISVAGGGDVNGDGLDDLIIGGPSFAELELDRGRAWVVYGRTGGAPVELSEVAAGEGGFAIDGLSAFGWAGASVAMAGDLNGDGLGDVLVGAPFATVDDADYSGQAYVVYGGGDGTIDLLYQIADGRALHFGRALAGVGDVNGDGVDDIAIGAPEAKASKLYREGEVYVIFSDGASTGTLDARLLVDEGRGLRITGEPQLYGLAGLTIAGAGDLDGDGLTELLIAAPDADVGAQASAGRIYVVFGRSEGGEIQLGEIAAGNGGFALDGEAEGARTGVSAAAIGDFDGDRIVDLAIGSTALDRAGADSGRAYVIFGFGASIPEE